MQIFDYIRRNPGAHLRQIKRELNLAMGVLQYHIYRLQKEGRIISKRTGLYKRFFPNFVFGESQKEILSVLSQETEREILLFLLQNPWATQNDIVRFANITPATANWHMKRLLKSGLVVDKHEGQNVRYHLKGNAEEVLILLRTYHPSLWERWADRLADTFNTIGKEKEEET